ncbi:MAG: class I SAM-dependent methyltransferase [Candidatus Krumholzibacteria bacterium]|nr:class I SAM-dependent methyltransferase [Candidatus Krumholzibacteria bacterium]
MTPNPRKNPARSATRPQGQITRGKTAPNRLRRVDAFLAAYDPALITRCDEDFDRALYVDLGYGAEPTTTLESAARLRRLNRQLGVLGVEIEPDRVARAQPFVDGRTDFRLGGFNLPLRTDANGQPETVRLVRAFNVLRQYDAEEVRPAYGQIMSRVLPGGLLMDGTSDPFGRVWTANMVRRTVTGAHDWELEALVLGLNTRGGLDPDAFQTRLPKSFIHRMVPGDPAFRFMTDWKAAARDTRSAETWGPRAWFVAAGKEMKARGYDIAREDLWLKRGWLVWRNCGLEI